MLRKGRKINSCTIKLTILIKKSHILKSNKSLRITFRRNEEGNIEIQKEHFQFYILFYFLHGR